METLQIDPPARESQFIQTFGLRMSRDLFYEHEKDLLVQCPSYEPGRRLYIRKHTTANPTLVTAKVTAKVNAKAVNLTTSITTSLTPKRTPHPYSEDTVSSYGFNTLPN